MKMLHAFRIALAFVVTFLIVEALGIHERSWPLITLCVTLVPSSSAKDTLFKAAQRVCGTLCGAAIGLLALWAETFSQPLMFIIAAIGAGCCGYFYHGKYPYAALILGVTMAVVCNAPAGTYHVALMRILGVLIGCVISSIFSATFFFKKD